MLVYTPQITNRVQFIFKFVFEEFLGTELELSSDMDSFLGYHGEKMNYSKRAIGEELFVMSSDLLLERGIKPQAFNEVEYNGHLVPFSTNDESSLFPFDIFSAAFYLMTRYEEYLPFRADEHGRYPGASSYAHKNKFLQTPVVDIWALELRDKIKERFPDLKFNKRAYKFIPSYDVDLAWCFKNKGWIRNLGGLFVSLRKLDFHNIGKRLSVLLGRAKDPFDTYQTQYDLHAENNLSAIYFILLGEYGLYDRNVANDNINYHNLIQNIADEAAVGIHPSYKSDSQLNLVKEEVGLLSSIVKAEITQSRQHFIRLKIPDTYQMLIDQELYKDFSMGYPDQIGFRASTASSFLFYDFGQEVTTPLRIYPFAVMDYTLQSYLRLSPEEAIQAIEKLVNACKEVGGLFIPLWHNHTLSEMNDWKGWLKVYESMMQTASAK